MGEKFTKVINWFRARKESIKSNPLVQTIKAYMIGRLNDKIVFVLREFGGLLTVWTVAIFGGLIAWVTGADPAWSYALAVGLGATGQFLTQFWRVLFGKPKTEEIAEEPTDSLVPEE